MYTGADPGMLKGGVQRNFVQKGGVQSLTRGNYKNGVRTPWIMDPPVSLRVRAAITSDYHLSALFATSCAVLITARMLYYP
jgi:hypothetical protein